VKILNVSSHTKNLVFTIFKGKNMLSFFKKLLGNKKKSVVEEKLPVVKTSATIEPEKPWPRTSHNATVAKIPNRRVSSDTSRETVKRSSDDDTSWSTRIGYLLAIRHF
jgi:hypothetical protein